MQFRSWARGEGELYSRKAGEVMRCPIGRAKPEAAAHRDVDYK